MRIDKGAWIRFILLGFALLNQGLVMMGYSPLPIEDADLEQFISLGFTIIMAGITGWKNNDLTKKARKKTELANKEIEKLEEK